MADSDSTFAAIWYPTFAYSKYEMFVDDAFYATSANLTSTTLTVVITEAAYYIKNVQSPIAKQPEVVFRTLLFSFLCLEMCAMAFLIIKLIMLPIVNKILGLYSGRTKKTVEIAQTTKVDHSL